MYVQNSTEMDAPTAASKIKAQLFKFIDVECTLDTKNLIHILCKKSFNFLTEKMWGASALHKFRTFVCPRHEVGRGI